MITTDQILNAAFDWIADNHVITPADGLTARSLDLDSLDVVEMILYIEEKLGIEIDDSLEMNADETLRQWAEKAQKGIKP